MKFNDQELNDVSKKNLGQLLTTLEEINCNQAVISIVKMMFWKNLDDIKMVLNK